MFDARLERRPVIVLSNNDGCAVARTNEAKALGIKMGQPMFQIRDLCRENKVAVFSSNYALYGDMSRRMNQIYDPPGRYQVVGSWKWPREYGSRGPSALCQNLKLMPARTVLEVRRASTPPATAPLR